MRKPDFSTGTSKNMTVKEFEESKDKTCAELKVTMDGREQTLKFRVVKLVGVLSEPSGIEGAKEVDDGESEFVAMSVRIYSTEEEAEMVMQSQTLFSNESVMMAMAATIGMEIGGTDGKKVN